MTHFTVHTIESAPEKSKATLTQAKKSLGFVPNLYGVLAESPAMLEAYATVGGIFDRSTSFTATERQVILLTAIFENECDYCMAAHSTIAGMQRVPDDVVEALRAGKPIADPKLEALSAFTRQVVRERGWASDENVRAFLGEHEPHLAAALERYVAEDFLCLRKYNHGISRCFSAERWAIVGEAGAFVDPLYSPGTDFIGFANCFATEMIRIEGDGGDVEAAARRLNSQYRALVVSTELRGRISGLVAARSTEPRNPIMEAHGRIHALAYRAHSSSPAGGIAGPAACSIDSKCICNLLGLLQGFLGAL